MKGKSGKAREVRLGKESVVKEGRQEKGGKTREGWQGKGFPFLAFPCLASLFHVWSHG
jgi:hypothetical protein